MPIIKSINTKKSQKIKLIISQELLDEIRKYCSWAKVENENTFFIQAAEFILKKDSDWKKYKKSTNCVF